MASDLPAVENTVFHSRDARFFRFRFYDLQPVPQGGCVKKFPFPSTGVTLGRRPPTYSQGPFMRFLLLATGLLNTIVFSPSNLVATPRDVSFSMPPNSVEVYDILELSATISSPDAANPFTAATLDGDFSLGSSHEAFHVSGFCDSTDGAIFRIRFMPSKPGTYQFNLVYAQDAFTSPRPDSYRSTIPVALHLGRYGRALLLQRHHCLLAARMERRSHRAVFHRTAPSAQGQPSSCYSRRPHQCLLRRTYHAGRQLHHGSRRVACERYSRLLAPRIRLLPIPP